MELESGASGYTHGTQIYLSDDLVTIYALMNIIPGFSEYMDKLLYHELFHCLTRSNPQFRTDMYSLIHFTVTDTEYELPPCVLERYISNPDVEHHNSYATFLIDGELIDCYTACITTKSYAEAQSGFMSNDATVLVPADGTDVYYTKEQASNFNEVFGTNTGYVTDPEECMADNFAYAMLYGMKGNAGKGYPNYPLFLDLQIISIHFSFFTSSFPACMHPPDICFFLSYPGFHIHIPESSLYPRN